MKHHHNVLTLTTAVSTNSNSTASMLAEMDHSSTHQMSFHLNTKATILFEYWSVDSFLGNTYIKFITKIFYYFN